jgi:Carboxypeptidase regulatory-like domain
LSARMPLTLGLLAWTLLAHDAGAQTLVPTPAGGTGRVSGRVTSTQAGSVADATISIGRVGSQEALTATSDQQGGFTFDRLAAGRYHVSASKPGYTGRQPIRSPAQQFDTGLEVTLQNGEHVSRVELTLHREASIAGRVAEPDGIPAPDVQVLAAVRRESGHVLLADTRTITEWDGRYRITGLPPGEYLVVVLPSAAADPARARANAERRAPESSSATRPFFEPTLYPGVTRSESARAVTVFEGIAVDGIDVWLTPAQRFSITGRVLRPDDARVENIAIEYANLSAQRSGLWTVPDPGDLFTITGVPQGTVVLLARADSDRGPLAGVVSTEVSQDDVEDLELRLGTPGIVEGRIVYETNVPASTRAKSIVLRQRLLPVSPLYPVPESSVRADGRFRIEHVLGQYEFEIAGLPPGLRVTRVVQHGRSIDARIAVMSGETITGLEVMVGR